MKAAWGITMAAVAAVVLGAGGNALVMADVSLQYDGYDDLGNGQFLHKYVGMRTSGDTTPVRDVHIEDKFLWDPGQITLTAPGDWSCLVYTGPSLQLYNWQVNEAQCGRTACYTVSASRSATRPSPRRRFI
jgi:hypothetical protein